MPLSLLFLFWHDGYALAIKYKVYGTATPITLETLLNYNFITEMYRMPSHNVNEAMRMPHCNYSTLPQSWENSHRWYINKLAWVSSNKLQLWTLKFVFSITFMSQNIPFSPIIKKYKKHSSLIDYTKTGGGTDVGHRL